MEKSRLFVINNSGHPKVYLTLPVLNEFENLPQLMASLENQHYRDWELIVCVNQPDEWWNIPDKLHICENNKKTLGWFKTYSGKPIVVIDKSTPEKGWQGKKHGVGWARKTAMDAAFERAQPTDLIVSIDADTFYPPDFLSSVTAAFKKHPSAAGLAAPYYHRLTGQEIADRCILRYEMYMRNYALNMLLIDNPYAFSAIGSGMACKAAVYRQNGGLTPKMSGEDFYFIQKLRKQGPIIIGSNVYIYPEARFSDRVYFGTGPAMIRGRSGNWDSYPVYNRQAFQEIKQTFGAFAGLYKQEISTPMDEMLNIASKGKPVWQPLRENAASEDSFIKACMQRVDALRILQFLKETNERFPDPNEERLASFLLSAFHPDDGLKAILQKLSFGETSIQELDKIRDFMAKQELILQENKGIL